MPKLNSENLTDPAVKALAYLRLKKQADDILKEVNKYKGELRELVETSEDVEVTDKGHRILTLTHAGQEVELKLECRVSTKLVSDAEEIIRGEASDEAKAILIEKVEVVRTDRIEQLHLSGDLDDEFVAKLYNTSESFAFKAKKV